MKAPIKRTNLRILSDYKQLSLKAVEIFAKTANLAQNTGEKCYIAISGGKTPEMFFQLLAEEQFSAKIPWPKIHLFWADERCVPQNSSKNNYHMAKEIFIDKINLPAENIYPIPTNFNDYRKSVTVYEELLKRIAKTQGLDIPVFDAIFLGMGRDGHTASLFPYSAAIHQNNRLVSAVKRGEDKVTRISLTPPVLKNAKQIIVLVSGQNKAQILTRVFDTEPDPAKYPIQSLWPVLDKVTWLVDKPAASLLK